MRLSIFTLLALIVSGCGAQQQLSPTPTAVPVVVVVTATPAPTVVGAVAPTVAMGTRQTTPEEDTWTSAVTRASDAFDVVIEKGTGYLASPPTITQADWADSRASFAQAVSDYHRTPVPPTLVKADYLVSEWFKESDIAFSDVELAVSTGSDAAFAEVQTHLANSKALAKKAADEIGRVGSSPAA